LCWTFDRLRNIGAHNLAEPFSQPVDRDFHSAFVHPEPARRVSLRQCIGLADEPRLQRVKLFLLAGTLNSSATFAKRPIHKDECPLTVEEGVNQL